MRAGPLGWSSGEARTDVSEGQTKRSDAIRIASTGLRLCMVKSTSVWPCLMPKSVMRLSVPTLASSVADSALRLLPLTLHSVNELRTRAGASAFAPSGPMLLSNKLSCDESKYAADSQQVQA